ncbi:FAD-dependent oxidoreductase [Sulfitobacter sp. F26204]|uniref:NAD(P)/FAD-dependent oxidoreductase n=1 Tax=Sulfitobacter sp. F26204 TaxID=2996014 RepID=UPI00225E5BCE|nr:FAD-dependent oxidoreductase [Sulfitobacter sp. F26204]MCX7558125.1 FAD-dependent oxidoreductase [Sulfitobacter sp. F26204]
MRHIYPDYAYSDAPRAQCWWDQTCPIPDRDKLTEDATCDVAIVGGGFTGISTALHLAEAGLSVMVLENRYVGWGASGRNGGFCCLGGGMLDNAALEKSFGRQGRDDWRQTELAAIRLVEALIDRFGIEVDRHSDGETKLAHRARDFEELRDEVDYYADSYGLVARLTTRADLAAEGMKAGFEGAVTVPIGFGLNPRKYITGLATAAETAGARIFHETPVTSIARNRETFALKTPQGTVRASKVVIATNGYSSEDLPDWLSGRYMPTQSSVIVTRPMSSSELDQQGWNSMQASYDTRHLLHYFRLMPDKRMLFGVRGGLMASPGSEARAIRRARADFEAMFPAWQHVETPNAWSGMVCIARNRMPFVAEIPDTPDMFASLCYHGNGVAMASYCGALLADLVQEKTPERIYPQAVQRPLAKFELGRWRRALMPIAYAGFALKDR